MNKLSDEDSSILREVKRCDRLAHAKEYSEPSEAIFEIPRIVEKLREENACLSLKELKVGGEDLIAMGIPKGKEIGRILNALLEKVLDGELENEKDKLLDFAKEIS